MPAARRAQGGVGLRRLGTVRRTHPVAQSTLSDSIWPVATLKEDTNAPSVVNCARPRSGRRQRPSRAASGLVASHLRVTPNAHPVALSSHTVGERGVWRRVALGVLGVSLILVSTPSLSGATPRGVASCASVRRNSDLVGCNLSGMNLSGMNLTSARLKDADLAGADLAGANLRLAKLIGADLAGADLQNANLTGARLRDANLQGAQLAGADMYDVFSGGVTGEPASMPGRAWGEQIVDGYLFGLGSNVDEANLSGIDLSGAF